ncbi:ABC transporter permease [Natrononativus amylolyticus]|uniref:ABC transporter permease n=1 Tax=Natrononativus amylolyticus TaxID=2963434 RepID=UPI0020CCF85B|nr:ABC transporter permease subunit [Natrononativus amylolyticus]
MSTLAVARKDFLDVRRAKIVWFVGGIYALFMVLLFYFGQRNVSNPQVESQLGAMMGIGALIIPLIALVAAYLAIAGERESGSIKYLLSIPNNRRDVVLGKFLSRAAIVTAAILVAFALGVAMALAWYPSLEAELFARVAALTVLYALTYVAVAIGISAATGSRSRAMGGAIGFFFVTNVLTLLPVFENAISYVLADLLGMEVTAEGMSFVQAVVSPTIAYTYSMRLAFPDVGMPTDAWYLEGEVMLVILFAWVLVPVLAGLWRFQRVDLG